MKKRRSSNDYVNNKDFLEAMKQYKKRVEDAEAQGKRKPVIPDYIGTCLMDIADGLARRPNFYNYTYKDEMIGDGIENALRSVDNFDPEKSSNPFAYFSQVIYFAFVRRIKAEKKQQYVSMKAMENNFMDLALTGEGASDSTDPTYHMIKQDYAADFVKNYEQSIENEKIRKKNRANKDLDDE